MKNIISISEIVAGFSHDAGECEVCATAEASYDESHDQLLLELDSFIRPVNIAQKEQHRSADWLPKKQTARELVHRSEATDLAKEIFHRWAAKVRQSVPVPIHSEH